MGLFARILSRLAGAFSRRRAVQGPATPQQAVEASFPPLATLDQLRQMRVRLRDFDPSYDAELHAKMLAVHAELQKRHPGER